MEASLGVRVFSTEHPVASMATAGAVAERVGGDWRFYPERPDAECPDHVAAFEAYKLDHLADLSGVKPAPQAVYREGDRAMAVVLDTLAFGVLEDGVEYRYRVDVPVAQAICTGRTDDETGLVAERTVPDERLADGMQRSADALEHGVEWLAVISPRSLGDVVESAAMVVTDDAPGAGTVYACRACGERTLHANECPACGCGDLRRAYP